MFSHKTRNNAECLLLSLLFNNVVGVLTSIIKQEAYKYGMEETKLSWFVTNTSPYIANSKEFWKTNKVDKCVQQGHRI